MNMMISKRFAAFVIAFIPSLLLANGGGISMSSTLSSGNIALVKNESIKLVKEFLSVTIDGDYSDVSVKYIFNNDGSSNRLMYGFPVSYRAFITEGEPADGSSDTSSDNITDFKMKFNGAEISSEKLNQKYKLQEEYRVDEYTFNSTGNRWYIANLEFPEGESTLEVKYRIENIFQDDLPGSKGGFRSYSDREFIYTLSPSGSWGNGTVKEFVVTVDFTKAAAEEKKLIKIDGLNLKKNENIYAGSFKNFKMDGARPLIVSYMLSKSETASYHLSGIYECQASSSSEGYDNSKASDFDPKTAWMENSGKGGKGEWVKFDCSGCEGMAIVNGMAVSEELYYKYNRIKKIRLEKFYQDNSVTSDEITLEDKKYSESELREGEFYTILYTSTGGDGWGPEKAKITILEVYPGTEFNRTCISEIYIIRFRHD